MCDSYSLINGAVTWQWSASCSLCWQGMHLSWPSLSSQLGRLRLHSPFLLSTSGGSYSWWTVHCHSHQTPLLLGCRTFSERTGSTGGTLSGTLLAVAMKPGEGLIAKQTIEKYHFWGIQIYSRAWIKKQWNWDLYEELEETKSWQGPSWLKCVLLVCAHFVSKTTPINYSSEKTLGSIVQ